MYLSNFGGVDPNLNIVSRRKERKQTWMFENRVLRRVFGPKVKDKSCPCALNEPHAMESYWGSGGIAPRILDLGIRW